MSANTEPGKRVTQAFTKDLYSSDANANAGIQYELYLYTEFPELAETLTRLSAEIRIKKFSFSTSLSSDSVFAHSISYPVFKSFRRAERTDCMARSYFSFREAEAKYPHLFAYL